MFPSMGVVPPNGWFRMENPIKMDDDWGYRYFRKPLFRIHVHVAPFLHQDAAEVLELTVLHYGF